MSKRKQANRAKVESATAEVAKVIVMQAGDEILTTREAAALSKMSAAYYEKMRWMKVGPPYLKRGRTVRYLKSQLLKWWAENQNDQHDSGKN